MVVTCDCHCNIVCWNLSKILSLIEVLIDLFFSSILWVRTGAKNFEMLLILLDGVNCRALAVLVCSDYVQMLPHLFDESNLIGSSNVLSPLC